MNLNRALEIFIWGESYSNPKPKNHNEIQAALEFILGHKIPDHLTHRSYHIANKKTIKDEIDEVKEKT